MAEISIDLRAIRSAARTIAPFVHRTPLLTSESLDALTGAKLLLKAEHRQVAGAFKARGAHNAVFSLDETTASRGVATHSSGNHGAALALAARNRKTRAFVVMPTDASSLKRAAVAEYGAQIIDCEPTQKARESTLTRIVETTDAHFVHPYEDPDVIRGQATVALEIAEDAGSHPPDVIVVPVGGGGLLAGIAAATRQLLPECCVIGAEPCGADDAYRGFHSGLWQPQETPATIADGLRTSLGRPNFVLIREHVNDILTVDDNTIIEAMQLLSREGEVVEPSGAVGLALLLAHPTRFAGLRVAIVLSGGNVDPALLRHG